jgi:branched-chain amino acid transport system substrate-binding protein
VKQAGRRGRGCTLIGIALLLVAAGGSGCRRRQERVVFGVALTDSAHAAVRLAAEEINAGGGIRGVPLELQGLQRTYEELMSFREILRWGDVYAAEPDLVAVIGHSDSDSTLAAAAIYNQRGLPQIVTIASNPDITNVGPWTYRICLSDAYQGPALADYAVGDWGKRRIAVLYVNDDYGRGLVERFEERVRALGAQVVASVFHRNVLGAEDHQLIRSTLARLRAEGPQPDLFVLIQRPEAAAWTIRAIRETGFDTDILGGESLGIASFPRRHGGLVEGMRAAHFFLPPPKDRQATRFVERYRQRAGRYPDDADAFAYDAVYLLRDAVAAEGFTRAGVKRYLDGLIRSATRVEGATGSYVLGADHDARRVLYVGEARGGVYRLVREIPVR